MLEFQYAPRDFESPDALMRTLDRMDTTQVNSYGYNQKFFQAVTNQGKFESDAWFDLAFDIGAKDSLRSFLDRLSEWQTRSGSSKVFLPDIVEDAARSNAWVADALQASGLVAAPEAPGPRGPWSPSLRAHGGTFFALIIIDLVPEARIDYNPSCFATL